MSANPRFDKFLPFIFSHECEYEKGHYGDLAHVVAENVAGDNGGVTKWGIDKASHPHVDVANLTQEQATVIYLEEWTAGRCDDYGFPLGEALFDAQVNCGAGRAAKLLAEIDADAETSPVTAAKAFCGERRAFYERLADQKSTMQKFLHGWLNRVDDLEAFLSL